MNALRHRLALVLLVLVAATLFVLPFGCDAARSAAPDRVRFLPRPDTVAADTARLRVLQL